MNFEIKDTVLVRDNNGFIFGKGVIAGINEFREPNMKYAISAEFYKDDYLFVGEENLELFEEVSAETLEEEYKRIAEVAEVEGLYYSIMEGYILSSMTHDIELKIAIEGANKHMGTIENKLYKYSY